MASAVERIAGGLLGIPKDSVVKLLGLHARAPNGLLAGHGSQLHGGKVAQFAAITAHGRARATDDRDIDSL